MRAFQHLGEDAGGVQAELTSRGVMVGVAQALVATAVGLLVAVPAVAAFNHFQRRIAESLGASEALVGLLLAHLHTRSARSRRSGPRGGT
jgi:biopolymer transport protein ExbB